MTGPLTGEILEGTFKKYPDAKAVVVTSPTYYGVLSDLDELGRICHAHGAKLLVDRAHGAHLPLVLEQEPNCLLGYNPYNNVDGVTVSAHKTLPAPGQTAVVFANGVRLEALKAASALTSTTSPAAMLAALDKLRPWMDEGGAVTAGWRRGAPTCAGPIPACAGRIWTPAGWSFRWRTAISWRPTCRNSAFIPRWRTTATSSAS